MERFFLIESIVHSSSFLAFLSRYTGTLFFSHFWNMAPRIADEVWEQYRDEIIALYCAPKGTLRKTMDIMKEKYGFQATYWWLFILCTKLEADLLVEKASILRSLSLGVYRSMPTTPPGFMRTKKQGNESWRRTRKLGWSPPEEKGHRRKSKERSTGMSRVELSCSYWRIFPHPKAFRCSLQGPKYLLHRSLFEKCAGTTFQVFNYRKISRHLFLRTLESTTLTLFEHSRRQTRRAVSLVCVTISHPELDRYKKIWKMLWIMQIHLRCKAFHQWKRYRWLHTFHWTRLTMISCWAPTDWRSSAWNFYNTSFVWQTMARFLEANYTKCFRV